eukprot:916885-Rhodomonas_salina.1
MAEKKRGEGEGRARAGEHGDQASAKERRGSTHDAPKRAPAARKREEEQGETRGVGAAEEGDGVLDAAVPAADGAVFGPREEAGGVGGVRGDARHDLEVVRVDCEGRGAGEAGAHAAGAERRRSATRRTPALAPGRRWSDGSTREMRESERWEE